MTHDDEQRSVTYAWWVTNPTVTAFPRCGHRYPIGDILCGRRLAVSYGHLRCRAHGDLDDHDVLPAILPKPDQRKTTP